MKEIRSPPNFPQNLDDGNASGHTRFECIANACFFGFRKVPPHARKSEPCLRLPRTSLCKGSEGQGFGFLDPPISSQIRSIDGSSTIEKESSVNASESIASFRSLDKSSRKHESAGLRLQGFSSRIGHSRRDVSKSPARPFQSRGFRL